jgi:hypothetical protein
MPSNKDGSRWFETDVKLNGSTEYATLQSILESDLKLDPGKTSEKPILK